MSQLLFHLISSVSFYFSDGAKWDWDAQRMDDSNAS